MSKYFIVILLFMTGLFSQLEADSYCQFEFAYHSSNNLILSSSKVPSNINTKSKSLFAPIDIATAKILLEDEWNDSSYFHAGLEEIHQIGSGEMGKDGSPAGLNNFTYKHIFQKYRAARSLGISPEKVRLLMEFGVLGGKNKKKKKKIKKTVKKKNTKDAEAANAQDYLNSNFNIPNEFVLHAAVMGTLLPYFKEKYADGVSVIRLDKSLVQNIINAVVRVIKPIVLEESRERGVGGVINIEYLLGTFFSEATQSADVVYYKGVNFESAEKFNNKFLKDYSKAKTNDEKYQAYIDHITAFNDRVYFVNWGFLLADFSVFDESQKECLTSLLLSSVSKMKTAYSFSMLNFFFYSAIESNKSDFNEYFGLISSLIYQYLEYFKMSPQFNITYHADFDEVGLSTTKRLIQWSSYIRNNLGIGKDATEDEFLKIKELLVGVKVTKAHDYEFLKTHLGWMLFSDEEIEVLANLGEEKVNIVKYIFIQTNKPLAIKNFDLVERGLFQGKGLVYEASLESLKNLLEDDGYSQKADLLSAHIKKQLIITDFKNLPHTVQQYLIHFGSLHDLIHLFARLDLADLKNNKGISNLVAELSDKISSLDKLLKIDLSYEESDFLKRLLDNANTEISKLSLMVLLSQHSDDAVDGLLLILNDHGYLKEPFVKKVFQKMVDGMSGASANIWLNSFFNSLDYVFLKPHLYSKLSEGHKAALIWREAIQNEGISESGRNDAKQSEAIKKSLNIMISNVAFDGTAIEVALSLDDAGLLYNEEIKIKLKAFRKQRKEAKKLEYINAKKQNFSKKSSATTTRGSEKKVTKNKTLSDFIENPNSFEMNEAIQLVQSEMKNVTIANQELTLMAMVLLLDMGLNKASVEKKSLFLDTVLHAFHLEPKQVILMLYFKWIVQYAFHLSDDLFSEQEFSKWSDIVGGLFLKSKKPSEFLPLLISLLSHSNIIIREYAMSKLNEFFHPKYAINTPTKKFVSKIRSVFDLYDKIEDPSVKVVLAVFLRGFSNNLDVTFEDIQSISLPDDASMKLFDMLEKTKKQTLHPMTMRSIPPDSKWSVVDTAINESHMGVAYLNRFNNFFSNNDNNLSELQRLLESASMEAAFHFETKAGRIPIDMTKTHAGYDIWSIDLKTGKIRYIEVKAKMKNTKYFNEIPISNYELEVAAQSLQQGLGEYFVYIVDINTRSGEMSLHQLEKINIKPHDPDYIVLGSNSYASAAYKRDLLMKHKVKED